MIARRISESDGSVTKSHTACPSRIRSSLRSRIFCLVVLLSICTFVAANLHLLLDHHPRVVCGFHTLDHDRDRVENLVTVKAMGLGEMLHHPSAPNGLLDANVRVDGFAVRADRRLCLDPKLDFL